MEARNTRQMEAIRSALEAAGRPLTPREILDAAQQEVTSISMATVYRRLKDLCGRNDVIAINLPGESPRYELGSVAAHHHHHFHCDGCDRVFDLDGCPGNMSTLAPPGFSVKRHEIVLYGHCDHCEADSN